MKIAVLSGKGGTGKTLVSVNLAAIVNDSVYADCDVEEPNGHLFFKPEDVHSENVQVLVPKWNQELCNGCRICTDFCKYNALAYIRNEVRIFPDICHSCGGCIDLCPQGAMTEENKMIGRVESGLSGNVQVISGFLDPGIPSGVPIIKKILERVESMNQKDVMIDCPPGSSCLVMESIKEADYCLLVAEPTVFGAQNVSMVYELVRLFDKPHGILLNKCGSGSNPSEEFAKQNNIPVLASIPFNHTLGKANAEGQIVVRTHKEYADLFTGIYETIVREVQPFEAITDSQR